MTRHGSGSNDEHRAFDATAPMAANTTRGDKAALGGTTTVIARRH